MATKKKYIVASLNKDMDYNTAYPIDIVYLRDDQLGDVFNWYRKHFQYMRIFRDHRPSMVFKYQTHTAWHKGSV